MEGKGRHALLCVLVVAGCMLAFAPVVASSAVADTGTGTITQADSEQTLHPVAVQIQDQSQTDDPDGETQVQTDDEPDEANDDTDEANDDTDETDDDTDETDDDESEEANDDTQEQQTGSERLNDAEEIHIDVFVHENGSATFEVDYRFTNDSDSNWQALREDVENNTETYVAAERSAWNETIADGANATGREMGISGLSVSTDTSTRPHDLGHVKVRFEWTGFAYVELNRIEVGDSLTGMTLLQDTTMEVIPPDGYVISTEESGNDESFDETVFWHGDNVDFANDPPSIVMIQNGNTNATEPEDEPAAESPSMPWLVVLAALALLATVGAAGWWIRDREILGPGSDPAAPTPTDAPAGEAERSEPVPSDPPPELLSNEERVLRLLEQRGGRIKQQEVVSELEWTEAKTSQVVSGLREDDEIDVFRIGRENVLSLPDEPEGRSETGAGTQAETASESDAVADGDPESNADE